MTLFPLPEGVTVTDWTCIDDSKTAAMARFLIQSRGGALTLYQSTFRKGRTFAVGRSYLDSFQFDQLLKKGKCVCGGIKKALIHNRGVLTFL